MTRKRKNHPTLVFYFFQFCEVGAMVIIQKKTQPNLATPVKEE